MKTYTFKTTDQLYASSQQIILKNTLQIFTVDGCLSLQKDLFLLLRCAFMYFIS